MLNFVPAAMAGLADGVTDNTVPLLISVIVKICTGFPMATSVHPTRMRESGAEKFVPVPVTVLPLMAIVPVV